MSKVFRECWIVLYPMPGRIDGRIAYDRMELVLVATCEDFAAAQEWVEKSCSEYPEGEPVPGYLIQKSWEYAHEVGSCKRCGSPLAEVSDNILTCTDQTCPFSDYDQSDDRGWTGHPSRPELEEA